MIKPLNNKPLRTSALAVQHDSVPIHVDGMTDICFPCAVYDRPTCYHTPICHHTGETCKPPATAAPSPMDTSDSELDALAATAAKEEEPSTPAPATKGAAVKAELFSSPVDLTTTPIEDDSLKAIQAAVKESLLPVAQKHSDAAMVSAVEQLQTTALAKLLFGELAERVEAVRSKAISDIASLEKGKLSASISTACSARPRRISRP